MLTILITIIAIIGWIGCVYYYGKAKENGHLFELSKSYEPDITPSDTDMVVGMSVQGYKVKLTKDDHFKNIHTDKDGLATPRPPVKLNKDGSITKKRGRKSKV